MLPSSSLEAIAKYHTHYGGNRDINCETVEAVSACCSNSDVSRCLRSHRAPSVSSNISIHRTVTALFVVNRFACIYLHRTFFVFLVKIN